MTFYLLSMQLKSVILMLLMSPVLRIVAVLVEEAATLDRAKVCILIYFIKMVSHCFHIS